MCGHFLQCFSIFTDKDCFLSFAFDHHHTRYTDDGLLIFERFGENFHRVGNFFLIKEQDFFSDEFIDKEPFRLIGQGIFCVVRWGDGESLFDFLLKDIQSKFFECRYRDDTGVWKYLLPRFGGFFQFRVVGAIHFIYGQDQGGFCVF